jgi:hypothetical protein
MAVTFSTPLQRYSYFPYHLSILWHPQLHRGQKLQKQVPIIDSNTIQTPNVFASAQFWSIPYRATPHCLNCEDTSYIPFLLSFAYSILVLKKFRLPWLREMRSTQLEHQTNIPKHMTLYWEQIKSHCCGAPLCYVICLFLEQTWDTTCWTATNTERQTTVSAHSPDKISSSQVY